MNDEYWLNRALEMEAVRDKQTVEYFNRVSEQYRKASATMQRQINAWYTRYATEEGISMAEAKRILTAGELEEFKWDVDEYIEKAQQGSTWAKQLERASTRVHVTRLESLLIQIQQQAEVLSGYELDSMATFLADQFEDSYYRSAFNIFQGVGIGYSFAQLDTRKIARALERPWAYPSANFSSRIWTNKGKLISTLDREITQMIITGEKPDTVVKRVAKTMDTSMYNASRLVQTEEAHISGLARGDCYKELDVERTQVVATLDERTCATCGPMDGTIFNESERNEGVNCAPFHPWCRCTDAPYYDDMEVGTRTARGEDGKTYRVPADMTYEQWKNGLKADKDGQLMPKDADVIAEPKISDWGNKDTLYDTSDNPLEESVTGEISDKDIDEAFNGTKLENLNLTADETKAFVSYSGSSYADINGVLRKDPVYMADMEKHADFAKDINGFVSSMDSTIERSVLTKDSTVFRKVDASKIWADRDLTDLKVYSDSGYMSTSLSREEAILFERKASRPMMMTIKVPKSSGSGVYIAKISNYPEEMEYIMKRGSNFKVLKYIPKNDNGIEELVLQLMP